LDPHRFLFHFPLSRLRVRQAPPHPPARSSSAAFSFGLFPWCARARATVRALCRPSTPLGSIHPKNATTAEGAPVSGGMEDDRTPSHTTWICVCMWEAVAAAAFVSSSPPPCLLRCPTPSSGRALLRPQTSVFAPRPRFDNHAHFLHLVSCLHAAESTHFPARRACVGAEAAFSRRSPSLTSPPRTSTLPPWLRRDRFTYSMTLPLFPMPVCLAYSVPIVAGCLARRNRAERSVRQVCPEARSPTLPHPKRRRHGAHPFSLPFFPCSRVITTHTSEMMTAAVTSVQ
jgi:hypothetical protein